MPFKRYLNICKIVGILYHQKMRQTTLFRMKTKLSSEKKYRSVIKAISWRTVGTIDTMIVSFLITGNVKFAVSIGGFEVFTKMVLYYLHERVWNRLKFGKTEEKEIDYQI